MIPGQDRCRSPEPGKRFHNAYNVLFRYAGVLEQVAGNYEELAALAICRIDHRGESLHTLRSKRLSLLVAGVFKAYVVIACNKDFKHIDSVFIGQLALVL